LWHTKAGMRQYDVQSFSIQPVGLQIKTGMVIQEDSSLYILLQKDNTPCKCLNFIEISKKIEQKQISFHTALY
ncbi:MAG: hypothetical protein ACYDAP_11940, partial [Thermoplasmataceae archaeon]